MRRILTAVAVALGLVGGALATAPANAIVNGVDATSNPGVVSLWTDNPYRNRCSGTLLDDGTPADGTDVVMTAAHCIYSFHPAYNPNVGRTMARIGSVDNTVGYTEREVVEFLWHPGYDPNTWVADIMLLRLESPVDASVQKPVKWNLSSVPVGTIGTLQGYGWVCDGPPGLPCSTWYVGKLQKMAAKILPDDTCTVFMTEPGKKACYEDAAGEHTMACPGDSGSSFLTKAANGDFQARIIVVGDGDGDAAGSCTQAPGGDNGKGMGTDVAAYRFWIQENIDDGCTECRRPSLPPAPTPEVLELLN